MSLAPTLIDTIAARYDEGGAGFVHDLNLRIVAAEPGRVEFVLPVTDRLVHGGGVLCGQTILSCMDTGMVYVMMSLSDNDAFTTVSLNTVFERAVPGETTEVTFVARATRPGRTLVYGEVELFLPDGKRAAHATTTYMWLNS